MNEDAKLLTQALAALVLLVDGDHDKDCRYQNTPINECPTCSGRHTKIAREAIKALTKRVAVYTAAPSTKPAEHKPNCSECAKFVKEQADNREWLEGVAEGNRIVAALAAKELRCRNS